MIETFQLSIAAELGTKSELSRVEIITERKGDIASLVDEAVAKLGVCLVILTPFAGVEDQEIPGPVLDPLRVTVASIENVALADPDDASRPTAWSAALAALQYLHRWTPPGFPACLSAAKNALELVPDDSLLVYHVNLQTILALQPKSDPRRIPS